MDMSCYRTDNNQSIDWDLLLLIAVIGFGRVEERFIRVRDST